MSVRTINALLIEDCDADAVLLCKLLASSASVDVIVRHVKSLMEALVLLESPHFDVVIADLCLPDSDGLSTVTDLRQAVSGTPIVALTGSDDEQFGIEVIRAGADDFVPKSQLNRFMITRSIAYSVERAASAERLGEINQVLEAKNRRISAMYQTSHKLINNLTYAFQRPLTTVRETALLVRDGVDGPVNSLQYSRLNSLLGQISDLADLTDDVLATSMLETGLMTIRRDSYDLIELIESSRSILEERASVRSVQLNFDFNGGRERVYCDAEKFRRLLINVVGDAIKAVPFHGVVNIALERVKEHWLTLAVTEQHQVDGAATTGQLEPGVGQNGAHLATAPDGAFGVSVSRALAELNFGKLEVHKDAVGQSQVSVHLPLSGMKSIMHCFLESVESSASDVSYVSLFRVAPSEFDSLTMKVLDEVDDFLRNYTNNTDLLLRKDEWQWLVFSNCTQAGMANEFDRLQSLWHKHRQNYCFGELPELCLTYEVTGLVPLENDKLTSVLNDTAASEVDGGIVTSAFEMNQRGRVLVVVEDPNTADQITDKLNAEGYVAHSTYDGFSGLMLVRDFKPDVLLLELQLPELDGSIVLRQLKADPEYASIPIIAMVGDKDELQTAQQFNADSMIQKPPKIDMLLEVLDSTRNKQALSPGGNQPDFATEHESVDGNEFVSSDLNN